MPQQFAFSEIVGALPEPVLLVSGDGEIMSANPAAAHLLGSPVERLRSRPLSELTPDPEEKVRNYLHASAASRQPVLGALTLQKPDGEAIACRCEGSVLRPWSPSGAALVLLRLKPKESASTRFVLLNNKIDELNREIHARRAAQAALLQREAELRALNERLEEEVRNRTQELLLTNERLREREAVLEETNEELRLKNRELQDFASVASHDLQEPLRKINTFTSLVLADHGHRINEEGRSYLARIQSASIRMSRLISDLLAYTRVATKGQPFERVDLNQIAAEVLSDLETRIAETGGEVVVDPLPTIEADPTQMRQLFQNLIGNALKFHRPGAAPLVRVYGDQEIESASDLLPSQNRPQVYRLHIEDNGIGFKEKYAEIIFAPFQRLHGRSEYEGTGVGLAICRRIAERHGGTITVRSAPGEGSDFVVELPLPEPRTADLTKG